MLSVLPNVRIEDLRRKLRQMVSCDLDEGERVRVTDGTYRSLEGDIVGSCEDEAFVHFQMRSLEVIASIPKVLLEAVDED